MAFNGLTRLSEVSSVETLIEMLKYQSDWLGWKRVVIGLLEVFDETNMGMTIQEMCEIMNVVAPMFLQEGPCGGKTTRNTLSSVCTNGVKNGTLIVTSYVGNCRRYGLSKRI
tara:strand:+ start:173 stop:508 length:336 start_codon:yes stop_codon:yes gene_type:complete